MINHGKMDNGPLHPDWGRTPSLPNVAEDMARLIRERDAAKTDIAEMLTAAEAEKARAVEAERERCAALADAMWGEGPSGSYDSGATQDGFNIATQRIAAAIRTGAKP
jgi:hypothetical protein